MSKKFASYAKGYSCYTSAVVDFLLTRAVHDLSIANNFRLFVLIESCLPTNCREITFFMVSSPLAVRVLLYVLMLPVMQILRSVFSSN